jgi:hypothetical protein
MTRPPSLPSRSELPVAFAYEACCPNCKKPWTLKVTKLVKRNQGDGSKLQRARCVACGERCKIVREPKVDFLDVDA